MELGSEIAAAGDTNAQAPHDVALPDGSFVNPSSETLSAATNPAERDEAMATEPVSAVEPCAEVLPEDARNASLANVPQTSLPNGEIEGSNRSAEEHQRCDHGMADRLDILDSMAPIREQKSKIKEVKEMETWKAVPSVPEPAENTENLVGSRNVPEMTPASARRRSFFVIKMPRAADKDLISKIRLAELQLEEASKTRDVIRAALQLRRASKLGLLDKLKVVRDKERGCKEEFQKKRLEIDPLQSALNKLKFADAKYKGDDIFSEEDLDNKIASLQHRIQHESIPLKEEKQLIREIKQLESQRSQVCANDVEHAHLMENYGSKEDILNQLEIHYSELDVLRANQNCSRLDCKPIEKELEVLNVKIDELVDQLEAAKHSHSSALAACKELKKNLNEQNAGFYKYRDSSKKARELASAKNLECLSVFCNEQVESVLSSWNNISSFRERYIKNNIQSTLRRLETLDGRSLGVDEEPLLLINDAELAVEIQPKNVDSLTKRMACPKEIGAESSASSLQVNHIRDSQQKNTQHQPQETPQGTSRSISRKKQGTEANKSGAKRSKGSPPSSVVSAPSESAAPVPAPAPAPAPPAAPAPAPAPIEDAEAKEAQAAERKDKQRQEQIAKAREAVERKRRQAERSQAKAQLRAQKEAERREKERAKKAKKKSAASIEYAETSDTCATPAINSKEIKELPKAPLSRPFFDGKGFPGKQIHPQKFWQSYLTWLFALLLTTAIGLASFFAPRFWS